LNPYARCKLEDGIALIKKDSAEALRTVTGAIFDCDGVLIDTSDSYDKTIVETVNQIGSRLLGIRPIADAELRKDIQLLRMTGGFNNDWNTCYVLLLAIALSRSREWLQKLQVAWRAIQDSDAFAKIFTTRKIACPIPIKQPDAGINRFRRIFRTFLRWADSSGPRSIEEVLAVAYSALPQVLEAIAEFKRLLEYPEKGHESVLAQVFDQIYYGKKLYRRLCANPRIRLRHQIGLIENERLLVKRSTLERLTRTLGRESLGIVSGRSRIGTEYTLRGLMRYFNPKAQIFVEDLERQGGIDAVEKPDPRLLLRASATWGAGGCILYVGDSVEDVIMTQRANQFSERFLFAGIYGDGAFSGKLRRTFMRERADFIIASVNDVPNLDF
jgi:HAD superfamily hydrolase (TIGR01548 family)